MAADRTAHVTWSGSLMEGSGTITSVESGAFGPLDVSWAARTEDTEAGSAGEARPLRDSRASSVRCVAHSRSVAGLIASTRSTLWA